MVDLDNDPTKLTPVGFLGVSPVVTYTRGGPVYTVRQMGWLAKESGHALATLPVKVWGVAEAIAGVKPRAADSPVSVVGGGMERLRVALLGGDPEGDPEDDPTGVEVGEVELVDHPSDRRPGRGLVATGEDDRELVAQDGPKGFLAGVGFD